MNRRQWFDIQNQGDTGEIFIYSEIGESFWTESLSAMAFKEQLFALKGKVSTVKLRINSPGGSVFDGFTIYNLLRDFPARIETQIDGMAASIASIIALAGDTIRIAENGMMMIHDPWMVTAGDAEKLRQAATLLDQIKLSTAETYIQRTKMDKNTVYQAMAAETWYTAEEAITAGLAHELTQPVKAEANFTLLKQFKNTPNALIEEPAKAEAEPPQLEPEPDPAPEGPMPIEAYDSWRISLMRKRLQLG